MGVVVDRWLGGCFDQLIDEFNDVWGDGEVGGWMDLILYGLKGDGERGGWMGRLIGQVNCQIYGWIGGWRLFN